MPCLGPSMSSDELGMADSHGGSVVGRAEVVVHCLQVFAIEMCAGAELSELPARLFTRMWGTGWQRLITQGNGGGHLDKLHQRVAVHSSGSRFGIAVQGRVTDRFYRGQQPAQGGSGLGLAIAATAMERLGILLCFEPREGGGETATLVFPGWRGPGVDLGGATMCARSRNSFEVSCPCRTRRRAPPSGLRGRDR
jgi:hypothetical protein